MNNTSAANTRSKSPLGSEAEGIALCSAYILSFLFIVLGNLLTIVLFAANRGLRKRSLFLVINTACADLMLGTVSLPIYIYKVGVDYKLWTGAWSVSLIVFYSTVDAFFAQASLISVAFISGERFYATYWPFKHRTLSIRAYRILICIVWTMAIVISTVCNGLFHFFSFKHSIYAWMPYTLILTFIICGCNISIWRKFQHGEVASQQQNRASQNKRLTKTLLFVSTLALLSWLPLIILNCLIFVSYLRIPWTFYYLVNIINYSNSFVNPIVYTLRIPEFRAALVVGCLRRPAAQNIEDIKSRNKKAPALTPATELRTLRKEPSVLQVACELKVLDTKL